MATKATKGRLAVLTFSVTGSTVGTIFSAVRNWSVRWERTVLDATNNDSSAWRELVTSSVASSAAFAQSGDWGQRQVTFQASAVYDISTAGPGNSAGRAQRYDRWQVMRHLVDGNALNVLIMRFGVNPASTNFTAGQWGSVSMTVGGGLVESVEVGGTYDAPVLYDLVIRGKAFANGI